MYESYEVSVVELCGSSWESVHFGEARAGDPSVMVVEFAVEVAAGNFLHAWH